MSVSQVIYENSVFYAWESVYLAFFDVLSPIGGCINIFAIIIILCKSPKKMGAYKWHLLNYQIISTLLDFSMTVLFKPVIYLPEIAGTMNGLLQLSPKNCFAFFITMALITMLAISQLFIYRFQVLLRFGSIFKVRPLTFGILMVATYIFQISVANYMWYRIDYNELTEIPEAIKDHPFLSPLQGRHGLLIIRKTYSTAAFFVVFILFSAYNSGMALFCIIASFIMIKMNSKRSWKSHLKLLKALIIQIVGPLVLLAIPGMISFLRLIMPYLGWQWINHIVVMVFSCHGLVSSILLLSLNRPYRKFIVRLFKGAADTANQVGSLGTSTIMNMAPANIRNLRYRKEKDEPEREAPIALPLSHPFTIGGEDNNRRVSIFPTPLYANNI